MAPPRLMTDEQLTVNVPQAESAYTAQPQTQQQANLLDTINNPPPANPLLQGIANPPDSLNGPSFGHQVANQLIGQIPLFGDILQQRHNQAFAQEQQGQHLQALAESAKTFPTDQQQILSNLVQQGRPDEAFKEYQKFAEMGVKQSFKSGNADALRSALKERIDRIADPVMRDSFSALAQTDPKSALIQVGNFENSQFGQTMRSRSDTRSTINTQISANTGLLKDIKDNKAGQRAFDIQQALIDKNFTPGDENLSVSQFMKKFGFDKKESSSIQLQLKNYINSKKTGGIFGIGKDLPPELKQNPLELLKDVPTVFSSPEAAAEQQKNIELKKHLTEQNAQLRKKVLGKSVAPTKTQANDPVRQEAIRRGLIKQ